jgi:hypothetical protein
MPDLTRRRAPNRHDCWHVLYGDVRVGTIAKRVGIPRDQAPWGWTCGFYPGSHPGECTNGTGATLDQARAGFEAAWRDFLEKRTEADFQAWRDQKERTDRKYAAWARGERLPSRSPTHSRRALAAKSLTATGSRKRSCMCRTLPHRQP